MFQEVERYLPRKYVRDGQLIRWFYCFIEFLSMCTNFADLSAIQSIQNMNSQHASYLQTPMLGDIHACLDTIRAQQCFVINSLTSITHVPDTFSLVFHLLISFQSSEMDYLSGNQCI